jgi:hypothetical protein
MWETKFHAHKTTGKIVILYFNLYISIEQAFMIRPPPFGPKYFNVLWVSGSKSLTFNADSGSACRLRQHCSARINKMYWVGVTGDEKGQAYF